MQLSLVWFVFPLFLTSVLSQAQTPSDRLFEVIEFSDGTVQIINPRFRVRERELRIFHGSDHSGVCRHFGFGVALRETQEIFSAPGFSNCDRPTAVLDRFGNLERQNRCGIFNRNESLWSLRCAPRESRFLIPETYLERYEQPDGTVTFIAPWFSVLGADPLDLNQRLYMNDRSDPDGVCRHFGFRSHVRDSRVTEDRCKVRRRDRSAQIGEDGRFIREEDCRDMILSITCSR